MLHEGNRNSPGGPPAGSRGKQRKGSPSHLSQTKATCSTCPLPSGSVWRIFQGGKDGYTDNDTTARLQFSHGPKQRAIRALSCALTMESPPTDIWMGQVSKISSSPDGKGVRGDKDWGRDQVMWQESWRWGRGKGEFSCSELLRN